MRLDVLNVGAVYWLLKMFNEQGLYVKMSLNMAVGIPNKIN